MRNISLDDLKDAYSYICDRAKQKLIAKNPDIKYPIIENIHFIGDYDTYVYIIFTELDKKYDITLSGKEYSMFDNQWKEYILHMSNIVGFIRGRLKKIDVDWYIKDDGSKLFKDTVIYHLSGIKNGNLVINYNGIVGKCWGVYNGYCHTWDDINNDNVVEIKLNDFINLY